MLKWVNTPARAVLLAVGIGMLLCKNLVWLFEDYLGKEACLSLYQRSWVESSQTTPAHLITLVFLVVLIMKLIKRGRPIDSYKHRRATMCSWCGKKLFQFSCDKPDQAELKAALQALRAHDLECDRNPILNELRMARGLIGTLGNACERASEEFYGSSSFDVELTDLTQFG